MAISWHPVGHWVAWAAFTPLLLSSCGISPEVKLASVQMTAALQDLRTANRAFQRAYLGEIDRTRADIEDAAVSRSVALRIDELSGALGSPEWIGEFRRTGLISLSREIEATQAQARALARLVSQSEGTSEEPGTRGVRDLVSVQMMNLRTSASSLRDQGLDEEAAVVEKRADEAGGAMAAVYFTDPILQAYLAALRDLALMASDVPKNMKELDDLANMLRGTHSVIHRWVMTDVRPSGAEIGRLLEEHAQRLGLGASDGEGGSR